MIFHPLHTNLPLPERFNNPFYYTPNPLCVIAAKQVQKAIAENTEWAEEVARGKMLGVLVVENSDKELGYLSAYSGQILGKSNWAGFVPAVFNYLQPSGYFKIHERHISKLNKTIKRLESSVERENLINELHQIRNCAEKAIEDYKITIKEAKAKRDFIRKKSTDNNDEAALIRESQYMKAELQRIKKRYAVRMSELQNRLDVIEKDIIQLKIVRKQQSDDLQNWLFLHFIMLNARGEKRNLIDIFKDTTNCIPPAGAGECCAPKLLQYAYLHKMRPLCMAEFWWGKSPDTELRTHLNYYPACLSKCKPILAFMLQGLDVQANELEHQDDRLPEVVYEDEYLAVVNKPTGMLSVPGKSKRLSVYDILPRLFHTKKRAMVVHRLDMQTGGLMLIAKTMNVYKALQKQFANHTVHKKYVALLETELIDVPKKGIISLPMRADINDRPRQMVDFEHGKTAITDYEVLEIKNGKTRVALYPRTGRTHQLRVHCAHKYGFNRAIIGDSLYGTRSDKLYLHAEEIRFMHPITREMIDVECPADF